MGSGPSKHDDATALLCGPLGESLRGWPLERVRMANRVFRHSGQGFLVYVEDVVRLIDVPRQTAVAICRAMSRNPRKDSVNVLTLLSVWTTLINAGSAQRTTAKIIRGRKRNVFSDASLKINQKSEIDIFRICCIVLRFNNLVLKGSKYKKIN